MSQKHYFQQLRQVFKNDPYQDRFLQELQDHAQDLESELPSSKKLTLKDMKKQFGDPKQVKETFTQITRPWLKTKQAWEAVGIGLICLLGAFMGSMVLSWIMGAFTSLFFTPKLSPIATILMYISYILNAFLIYFLYRWAWAYLKNKQSNSLWNEKQIIIFLLSPIAFILLGFIFQFIFGRGDSIFLLFGIFILSTALLARTRLPLNKVKKKVQKIKWSWLKLFSILIFAHVLVFGLVRFLNIEPDPMNVLHNVFTFIYLFEFFIIALVPLMISGSILVSAYLSIGLLISLFLFALGWMILNKRWSWLSGAVMIYVISTLFISYDSLYHQIEFSVPSQELSATLEQNQFGPFYGFIKENYHDLKDAFYYEIEFENGVFILNQIERTSRVRQFSFDPNKGWPDDLFQNKERFKDERIEIPTLNTFEDWPKNLKCERPAALQGMYGFDTCLSLSFRGQELINSSQFWDDRSYGIPFKEAVFSEDENWLLLKITPDMTPTFVYLLDLRSLN